LCKPSAHHAAAWFGVTLAGGVACSLHVRETPERLGETLPWLGACVLVYDDDLAPLARTALAGAPGTNCVALSALSAPRDNTALDVFAVPIEADTLAAIILSSGTTGRPKGVMHTHRTLIENAKGGQQLYGTVTTRDAMLVVMQPSFAAWVNVVLPMVGGRGKIVFDETFAPTRYLATLEREAITMAPAVPTMWRAILAEDTTRFDLSAIRNVSISGEPPVRADLEGIARKICPAISSFYASSEAGCASAVLATERDTLGEEGKPATTGKPVVGADLRIVDPSGSIDNELPRGETGEILVRGSSLAIGYWRDEALTRERFIDGWWRSGDLGRIDAEGDLFVEGRNDNRINSGGIKVHGEEIERVLLAHPSVAQAAVIGVPDAQWGERIEAHVVLRPGAPSIDAAALDVFCRGEGGLADFKAPKAYHFVLTLPTGPTGKLYRRALRAG
ncbi:MAG: class I adenylate-forming enzyme family protein, partial [Burkholderiales bacterium]